MAAMMEEAIETMFENSALGKSSISKLVIAKRMWKNELAVSKRRPDALQRLQNWLCAFRQLVFLQSVEISCMECISLLKWTNKLPQQASISNA
jgi:hypothetical protein